MKIEFLSPLMTERLGNRLWVLLEPFRFSIDGKTHEIPAGFVFDGNSSPRLMWAICSPVGGVYGEAGPVHDWFYSLDCTTPVSRHKADLIHKAIGVERGAEPFRAALVFAGIRAGGESSFRVKHSIEKVTGDTCYDVGYALSRVKKLKAKGGIDI